MTDRERIDLALEERLDPEDLRRLQEDVIADPSLRTLYAERAWLHGSLRADGRFLRDLAEAPTSPPLPSTLSRPSLNLRWVAAAVVMVVGLASTALWRNRGPVAVLTEAAGCKWAGSELPTAEGSRLGPGVLSLAEGMATIRFVNGASLTLEAPATLEIIDRMHCRLLQGSLVADVPKPAHGFTVDTPEMKVIDLGTRFGLTTSGVGNSHVLVFEGEVDVNTGSGKKRLTTGRNLQLGQTSDSSRTQEVERTRVPEPAEDGWISLPTSAGRGKDAYVRRGRDRPTGAEPLIMVKHTDLAPENQRRAYCAFDLRQLPKPTKELADATLVLDVESSGLGFSALVPDSRFAVYGLTEGALDAWRENGICWINAPASSDSGLDPAKVRRLGDFTIRRGSAPAQIEFSSPDLLEFLRAEHNDLATLVLLRETGESEPQGLVHAFASREHPTAHPPTLRLKFLEHP
ncbi:MAG: ferric-dicitrate binding protein FerR, regulates iron transport through sigma-19 [Verrucomicrobia bacterium]|jgi:ferric-dicitrate binding protein FerR (iron transport regulator)|nr:MAG: ferric-dicitrate binding protein FerR, regulates iron transport through sigma-19 [Verrucomicrobiota bacterium]